jgi:four helix bundle protein
MNELDHEQLDVYVAWADEVVERLPRGRAYLADQLQRAATSIALSIAEGARGVPDQRHGAPLSKLLRT